MWTAVTALNSPNKTQYFRPADNKWEMKQVQMKVSTAMTSWAAIGIVISSNTTTGDKTLMGVENASGADFVGILTETIASTDADYATSGKTRLCRVPTSIYSEAYFTVGAGTFTKIDEWKTVEIHSDSLTLAVDTAGKGARITKYISSTRGKCVFSLPATETA